MTGTLGLSLLRGVVTSFNLVLPSSQLVFQRAATQEDLLLFQHEYWKRDGVKFPLDYLQSGSCYLVRNGMGELIGGFSVVRGTALRALQQVPEEPRARFLQNLRKRETLVETTGVWLTRQRHPLASAVTFWARVWEETFFRVPNSVNVFACDLRKKRLVRLYESCCAGVVHRGLITQLPGMEDNGAQEEVVFFGRPRECLKGMYREIVRRMVKGPLARLVEGLFVGRRRAASIPS